MRSIILFFLLLPVLLPAQQQVTITGSVLDAPGAHIGLNLPHYSWRLETDTEWRTAAADGSFALAQTLPTARFGFLRLGNAWLKVLLVPGQTLEVTLLTLYWTPITDLSYNLLGTGSILLAMAIFYLHLYLLDRGFAGSYSRYLVLLLLLVLIAWPLDAGIGFLRAQYSPADYLPGPSLTYPEALFDFSRRVYWPALLGSGLYFFFSRNVAEKTIALQSESESRLAELRALKTQVQPHFLLNALNALYGDALEEDSPRTAAGIVQLSKLLQYLIYDADQKAVTLAQEVAFLQGYVDLQRERMPATVQLETQWPEAGTDHISIAPLLLLPLVENAFKHGVSARRVSPLSIRLSLEKHRLQLRVENPIFPQNREQPVRPGGVGLDNLRQRLQLLYPGGHTLRTDRTGDQFTAGLTLELATPTADNAFL